MARSTNSAAARAAEFLEEEMAQHKAAAERVLHQMRAAKLSREDMTVVIGHRLKHAADAFVVKNGNVDQFGQLYDLMCAMQRVRNEDTEDSR